jgi:hypothetical protein
MKAKNPALSPLSILIGEWNVKVSNASFLPSPDDTVTWQASIEWLEDAFMIWRSQGMNDFPESISIIGRNENQASDRYSMFYYDSRRVSRIYEMSFNNGVWKLWREDSDFFQRYEGKINEAGDSISGKWENSSDGKKWEHDFTITYVRIK